MSCNAVPLVWGLLRLAPIMFEELLHCVPELSITSTLASFRDLCVYLSGPPHDVCWMTLWEVVISWRRMAAPQLFLSEGREGM